MTATHTPADQLPRAGGVDALFKLAAAAGLRPHVHVDRDGRTVYAGTYMVVLNGEGVASPFGAVHVGARTGRVLRGCITFGNGGPTRRFTGAREVNTAVRKLALDKLRLLVALSQAKQREAAWGIHV